MVFISEVPHCSEETAPGLKIKHHHLTTTVDVERFAGLNVHGFSFIKVFAEILSRCLGQKYSLFSIIKGRHLYSQKNFHGTLENREKT